MGVAGVSRTRRAHSIRWKANTGIRRISNSYSHTWCVFLLRQSQLDNAQASLDQGLVVLQPQLRPKPLARRSSAFRMTYDSPDTFSSCSLSFCSTRFQLDSNQVSTPARK